MRTGTLTRTRIFRTDPALGAALEAGAARERVKGSALLRKALRLHLAPTLTDPSPFLAPRGRPRPRRPDRDLLHHRARTLLGATRCRGRHGHSGRRGAGASRPGGCRRDCEPRLLGHVAWGWRACSPAARPRCPGRGRCLTHSASGRGRQQIHVCDVAGRIGAVSGSDLEPRPGPGAFPNDPRGCFSVTGNQL